jgi:hypothetical protein
VDAYRALPGYSTDMQRDMDIDRTSYTQHERELLAEVRSSFLFVVVTVGILLFASVVGIALS